MGLLLGIVIIIHGYFAGPGPFPPYELAPVLEEAGYKVYVPEWIDNDPIIAAPQIGQVVDQARAENGVDKVHLVGVSLGGVTAMYYAHNMGGHTKLDSVITLDSPLYGLWNCYPGWIAMCPLSPFYNGLHYGDDTPGATFYKQIIMTPIVNPLNSYLLDGGVCPNWIPGTHETMRTNPAVQAATIKGFKKVC